MTQSAKTTRVERLTKLVAYMERGTEAWRHALAEPAVARALHARFGPAANEIDATRRLVADMMAAQSGKPKLPLDVLQRLHDALANLALLAVHRPPAPRPGQDPLPQTVVDLASRARAVEIETSTRKLLKKLRAALLGLGLAAGLALSLPAAAGTGVGDTITNPGTGSTGVIVKTGTGYVLTDNYWLVLTSLTGLTQKSVTDGVKVKVPTMGPPESYDGDPSKYVEATVIGVTINATTHLATSIKVKDKDGKTWDVVTYVDKSASVGPINTGGSGPTTVTLLPASGDHNIVQEVRVAAGGSNGRNGGGFKVFGVVIGVSAGDGGAGTDGESFTHDVLASNGLIEVKSDNFSGIEIGSSGGAGGRGGDAVFSFGIDGGTGGKAGRGGNVNVTNHTDITTDGVNSHGMHVFSRSGVGGVAGTVDFGVADGGAGGEGNGGGHVVGTNYGDITTTKAGAIGVFVQSLGGEAGAGGSSYGIVGRPGSALQAGTGGEAEAYNYGAVTTGGRGAHGVVSQSIGGTGGKAGDGIALVSLGNDGGGQGGAGGHAKAVNGNGGYIITTGNDAYGLVAQSIGGGGGDGGYAAGLVGLGGKGGAGGDGGKAEARTEGNARIVTNGVGSFGIFAQSIGGGGGNGGVGGGLAGIGGKGSGGGKGGEVDVVTQADTSVITTGDNAHGIFAESVGKGGGVGGTGAGIVGIGGEGDGGGDAGYVHILNAGDVTTIGKGARGIFAQSTGGGGGAAAGTGGLVSVGGSAGKGGVGGRVEVNNSGKINTGNINNPIKSEVGSDGIFAQSIGGGGGSGSASGGLVSLGGKGGDGGQGGVVLVGNSGTITTRGARARGIFAQSVGGGGGSGGDSGGLVSIGGTGGSATLSKGDQVTVDNDGTIITSGAISSAIQAQSVGGGGGDGGTSGAVLLSIGGSGKGGGEGGKVSVYDSFNLTTTGNDSHGIFAQSVGGGGGNGGSSTSISAFAGVSIGGSGGLGGNGGEVLVDFDDRTIDVGGTQTQVSPLILTKGDRAMGIFAESVGGGGGNGGFAVQTSVGYGASFSVAVGGAGGNGGKGGLVTLTGDAIVRTEGDFAPAVFAESVGGGGGNGGFSTAIAIAGNPEGPAGAFTFGLGGSGGKGGDGDKVDLKMGGGIYTVGGFSTGLLAQSVGGGGGNGGFNVSVAVAASSGTSVAVGVGIGGSGGEGGKGGVVDVHYTGDITTAGYSSTGALVQSVGGGGGSGGFNLTAAVGLGTESLAASVGLGGSGGKGGNADSATGIFDGDIETGLVADPVIPDGTPEGELKAALDNLKSIQSAGLVVQSVGGGGGSGGFNISGSISGGLEGNAAVAIGLGGSGGSAGNGGIAHGESHNIVTHADQSTGFLVQSVGGGGGTGGMNISGSIAISQSLSPTISIGLGGAGGGGGSAEKAQGKVTGHVATYGDDSDAIVAQSLGGGGGTGGLNVSGGISLSGENSFNLGVSLGGAGGKGGDGGIVDLRINEGVANTDRSLLAAYTEGQRSNGVLAQSLGGGGGNGGISVAGGLAISAEAGGNIMVGVGGAGGDAGVGKSVTGLVNGNVVTKGDDADAVVFQSIGGAGGNGGINVSGGIAATSGGAGNLLVGVGGVGGKGGNSGVVKGTVTGDIQTGYEETVGGVKVRHGDDASGVTIQSLGGGGGNGGINVTGGIAVSLGDNAAGNLGIGVGGFAGDASNGTSVTGDVTGNIQTFGNKAYGILMQSAGGAGGNGGINVTGGIAASAGPAVNIGLGLGGFGGKGGDSVVAPDGDQTWVVKGTTRGDVVTWGNEAFGAAIQSMGGGGGVGGINVTGNIAFSSGASGAGNIGIGIGGFGGGGGNSGNVYGDIGGTYQTHGDKSKGVIVQSVGGGGGNGGINVSGNITVATGGGAQAGGFSFGLGGFGGNGGYGGKATLVRTGDTETFGSASDAIFVQSVGGGGGNGAINVSGDIDLSKGGESGAISIGIGGFGGGGKSSGIASATVTGNVFVHGTGSGVIVQSIGGGGGTGGINITGQLNLGKTTGRGLAFGLGGFGGDGGDGEAAYLTLNGAATATVTATTSTAQVVAYGDKQSAVLVQSVGGGGGDGGFNITGGIAGDGEVALGLGGFGGDGGLGRRAEAHVDANLFASGQKARGMLVQSIGGGGGDGGFNITAAANKSKEISLAFGLGGFGGDGNKSGDVLAWHRGQISVDGLNASGLVAQSIAGGGGDGGLNVALDVNLQNKGNSIAVGVGGNGGDGADAGKVTVNNVGSIFINAGDPAHGIEQILTEHITEEDAIKLAEHSHALVAQSVGGGGGMGGVNVTAAIAFSKGNPLALGVGGSGGTGGNGGVVEVSQGWEDVNGVKTATPGTLRTYGEGSIALLAQSVGGGGGDAGFNLVVPVTYSGDPKEPAKAAVISVGGSGAGAGYGDTVTVDHRGNIITGYLDGPNGVVGGKGNDSGGILAQSVGGGGGNANLNLGLGITRNASALALAVGGDTGAAGKGGKVNVYHDGNIYTWGNDSTAITAQSIGGGGGNTAASIGLPALANDKLEISIGRRGGTGGEGDEVYVDAKGTLSTQGERSDGVFAQSVGGGGGRSGTTAVGGQLKDSGNNETVGGKVTVGLEGGEGAISKKVEVHAAGYVDTWGKDSYGIHAQSIGGGGGVGGLASNTIMRTNGSLNMAIGGDGGKGAKGGEVKVYNAAVITTRGENAAGIFAQSIGGGGGTGGNVGTLGIPAGGPKEQTPHMNLALSVGGSGGEGATGNTVYVENSGIITTSGKHAAGIRAESIGGGGGFGGTILSLRADTAKGSSQTMAINIGGDGGTGGVGDTVTVWNKGGSIWTDGEWSAGISAASIGGGGGEGGGVADFQAAAITGDGTYGNITVNMGGKGGQGGKGGEVNVTNDPTAGVGGTGQIVTTKDNSYGIFAQSLGGGGGNGGSVFSVTGGKGSKDSVSLGVNIGGSGDDGGTGGHVNVINRGLIDTTGNSAHGILAQSIGGGGGNGAMAIAGALLISAPTKSPLIAIGGSGGDGGDSGLVEVNNSGTIVTRGKNANGIFAQSIGGGGGNSTTGFSLSGNPYTFVGSNALAALIGALTTGNGGIGGEVKVTNTGSITTLGEGSAGIVGESINGGGGHLVLNFDSIETLFDLQCIPIPGASTCIPGTGGTTGERPVGQPIYSTTLGSTDSSDMNAGKVTIVNTGTIASGGANSVGMAIRSVGGGGGKIDVHSLLATTSTPDNPHLTMPVTFGVNLGALNAKNGTGSVIDSKQTGTIYTAAGNATGLRLQSIGGGGGDSLIDLDAPDGTQISTVDVKLGATNGSHLEGGAVGHIQDGAIVTTGAWSTAAHIQSIGGGGGTAMVDINAVDQSQLVTRAVLGADGGANLKAEAVTGSYDGLQTDGDHSVALLAQSIGGGGGAVMTTGSHALDVKLGGTNGAAGDGGSINLSNDGLIQAGGAGSHGVLLQSIGGGGGAVLTDATSITVGLNNGNSGNGGAITFGETGNIVTTGAGGYGLIAQSLGGGGGWVDGPDGNSFAGAAGGTGQGGAITLTLDGGVFASGTGATAIFAQSLGSLGGGNIALTTDGLVRGNAAGIVFNGGAANTITANGSVSAVSGLAINTGSGDDKVINTGLVVGNIDLGSGANAFNNQAGATFVAISTIDLSDPSGGNNSKLAPNAVGLPTVNGTFSNDGDFLMGLSAPRIPIDLAKGATFANLDAQGAPASNLMYGTRVINTVDLDGSFVQSASGHLVFDVAFGPYASDRVNVTGNATVAGTGDVTLTWLENAAPVTLFATAGTATDNGLNIKDTLALDYRIVTDKDGVKLAFTSDFAQPFLNRNERELGHHMDSAISLGGSGGIGRLMALIGNLQQGDETIYEGIFQELNPEPFLAPQLIQLGSARQFAGDLNYCDTAGNAPEHCVWGRLASSDTSRKGDSESFAYHGTLDGFETGFEKRIDDKWSVSGALGYDDLGRLTAGNGRAQFEGDSVHGGFGATRTFATGTKLDLSLTGGLQTVESERLIQVFGPAVATATPHSSYVMANARVSRQYDHGSLFARPAVSLALTSLRQGAFTEQGADGLGAVGVAHTQTFATLTPDLTVGYQSRDTAGTYTALSLSIGAAIHSTDRVKMPYRLAGANPNADPAWISTALDPSTVRYGANLQVVGQDDKASLNLSIATENGKRFSQQTFSLSARLKF